MFRDFLLIEYFILGVASYEIIWKDDSKCFDGLIPNEQLKEFCGELLTMVFL